MASDNAQTFVFYIVDKLASRHATPEKIFQCASSLNDIVADYMRSYPPLIILFGSLNKYMPIDEWKKSVHNAVKDDTDIAMMMNDITRTMIRNGISDAPTINALLGTTIYVPPQV